MQQQLHRWSICVPDGSHLLSDGLRRCEEAVARAGKDQDGKYRERWSSTSTDSGMSTESSSAPAFTVMMLGDPGVGKTALTGIFAGATDSLDVDSDMFVGKLVSSNLLMVKDLVLLTNCTLTYIYLICVACWVL